ncbi:hypothetical protein DSO57_1039070 [Entomophthora muscae]|uniref:Uncharacterized protein n=1 Tax=Entomophthora muscae TaxID=34485 RepID=A0ACC2TY10_9FUNG|nr:hypothetical protein DSO57_1039070 [Entomophthora muscae]
MCPRMHHMDIEKQLQPYTTKQRLARFFETRRFHYMIIGIVFTDLSLLLVGLVLAIYGTRETLLANFILFLFSWIFPTIFLTETALKVWVAGGPKKYFNTSIKKWDFGILIFSVVSDIALYVLLMEHASATATLVIIFRLWKIIRLFHVYAHMVQIKNDKIREQIEARNMELEHELARLKEENMKLRSELEICH